MKTISIFKLIFISALIIFYFNSCKKKPDEDILLYTKEIKGLTQISAFGGGIIYDHGHGGEWDVSEKGVCWSKITGATINDSRTIDGNGGGNFSSFIAPLEPNTKYFVRAYAVYKGELTYAPEVSFTTSFFDSIQFTAGVNYGTVTDIEGNTYKTVQIGQQTWMAENLKVKKYRNGTDISNLSDNYNWAKASGGAYCDYLGAPSYSSIFGRLYNWNAATSSNNICPTNWHVPSDEEWKELEMSLGMSQFQVDSIDWRGAQEGKTLKENGSSGFAARPDSYRNPDGIFSNMGRYGGWWTSTQYDATTSWYRMLARGGSYNNITEKTIKRSIGEIINGFYVRCVKD